MKKKLPLIIGAIIIILIIVLGFIVWQKSTTPQTQQTPASNVHRAKKVDLSSQPKWVQDLKVTAVKGTSSNGLSNVTIKVIGFPQDMVTSLSYTLSYETSNKGTQGALSTTPIDIGGKTDWTKTIDLGTCSTKTCVRHDGVTSFDLELDFTTSSGDQPVWTGTLALS